MTLQTAKRIVDFIFESSLPGEDINIGFFGGEPLLEFDLVKSIASLAKSHREFKNEKITFSIVSNGTIYSREIIDFIQENRISLCISSDGPPAVHDRARRFPDGYPSSTVVERTIRSAVDALPTLLVNSVYTPATLESLPDVVAYHARRGIKRIFLSPDYSAPWPDSVLKKLPETYDRIAESYVAGYRKGRPLFINLIDNKIAAMLRGGFRPEEKCRMGTAEFAFGPSGNIYPCERLVGSDDGRTHCIGNVEDGLGTSRMRCRIAPGGDVNEECVSCGVKEYCMNWCGCSNNFATGFYNRVSHFMCISEQSAIRAAFSAFKSLEKEHGVAFLEHLSGTPYANALMA